MSKFNVSTEAAFDVGLKEGRRQLAKHLLEIIEITEDVEFIKKHLKFMSDPDNDSRVQEVRGFFKVRSDAKED